MNRHALYRFVIPEMRPHFCRWQTSLRCLWQPGRSDIDICEYLVTHAFDVHDGVQMQIADRPATRFPLEDSRHGLLERMTFDGA